MIRTSAFWKNAAVLVLLWSGALRAGCPDPDRPTHEVTDMVETLNYYAEGTTLCIVSVRPDWCGSSCRSGYRHVCGQGGHWNPVEKCSSLEKKDAKLRSADNSSSQFGLDSTASMMREQMAQLEVDEEAKKQSSHSTTISAGSAKGGISGSGNNSCAKDNSSVMRTLETPELGSQVTSYATAYAQAGGPAPVAQAARAQVEEAQSTLNRTTCGASVQHQKACAVMRDTIKLNEHMALAAECEMRSH